MLSISAHWRDSFMGSETGVYFKLTKVIRHLDIYPISQKIFVLIRFVNVLKRMASEYLFLEKN